MKNIHTKKYRQILAAVVATGVCSVPSISFGQQSAATIEGLVSGTSVTYGNPTLPVITDIVSQPGTVDGYTYANWAALANDGTGSLDLFGKMPSGSTYTPTVGDGVYVAGTYSPYNSIPELASITSISLISSGNTVPSPVTTTIGTLSSITPTSFNYLGQALQLNNVTIEDSSGNPIVPGTAFPTHANGTYTITDGSSSMTMYFWASSYSTTGAMGGETIPTGPVDISGIVDDFGGTTPEFIPTSITAVVPEPSMMGLFGVGGASLLAWARSRKKA